MPTLEESIKTAIKDTPDLNADVKTESVQAGEETKTEETKQDETEKTDDSKEAEGSDLTELEQGQALQLFKALKDPATAGQIIDVLAQQAGYKREITAKTAEVAKDDIQEMLETALGPDLKFLSDKLAPVISKAIDKKVNENIDLKTKDIRDNLAKQAEKDLETSAEKAISQLGTEFFDTKTIPNNILDKMNALMDETPPSSTITVDRYVRKIFNEACGELGITAKKISQDKIAKNRNDAPSRLASERTGSPTSTNGSKKLSLSDAVNAAVKEITEKQ